MRRETIALHAGYQTDPATHACAVPIYQTAAYEFDSAEHGAALFDLTVPGNIYSRLSNPTNDVLEQRLTALEGGVGALTVSTGMAAIQIAIQNVTEAGTNIVACPQLYGATYTLFMHVLRRQGVDVRLARDDKAEAVGALIDRDTRAVFCESVGNPAGNISDIAALAAMAHHHGVPLIVDNTVATPMLLRPIEHGADVVVHSLTKFIGGHGTTMGGAIIDAGRFDWAADKRRFAMLCTPEAAYHDVVFTEQFGPAAFVAHCRSVCLRNGGAALSPLGAFLLMQGLETLALRMERHVANARLVAEFLRADPRVAWIQYAGFTDNPYHALALRYLGGHACSLLTFGVRGGFEVGRRFFDALGLFKRLVNLGDAKSLATHPASTTHRQLDAAALAQTGVTPEMIRLSIGIEHIDDIIADLDQALTVAAGAAQRDRPAGAAQRDRPAGAAQRDGSAGVARDDRDAA